MVIDAQTVAEKIKNNSVFHLKDHQIDGLKFLIKSFNANHGCILADEMGLGKTCQAISFLVYLSTVSKGQERYLILCPLSVLQHWKTEIERFGCGMKFFIYQGTKEERVDVRKKIGSTTDWEIILTTYEMALKDKDFFEKWTWTTVVVDEGHRLKNSESLLHQNLLELKVKSFLLLTGTPVQNNLDELYSLLSMIDKNKFPNSKRDGFLRCFGKHENSKRVEELREILEQYMLRRTKDIVCPDIPEKSEVILFHGLTEMQKKLYKAILSKNRDVFINSAKNKQKLMNTLMQLRKCVDHPYLFDGMEPEPFEEGDHLIKNCGKMIVLDCLLGYLFKHQHKVLIFSQMTRMLDILQDYLTYKGYSYERLDGSIRGEERYAAINRFTSGKGTFCFLLSTRAGGLGLTLTAADTVVFIDSDFNPQNDLQAAARAHRIGQDRPVKIIRLIARHSVEEYILKRAGQKLQLTNAILKSENEENADQLTAAEISEMLMFGLSQLGETKSSEEEKFNETHLTKLIGGSKDGKWDAVSKLSSTLSFDASGDDKTGDLYDFEGKNYRKQNDDDQRALKDIIGVEANELAASSERQNKGKRTDLVYIPLRPPPAKVLTPEELEQRRQRRAELAEQRKQREIENRKKREEALKIQKQKLWDRFSYVSANLPESEVEEPVSAEGDTDEEEEAEVILRDDEIEENEKNLASTGPIYVVGDVSHPKIRQQHEQMDAIVVHCVDNSGSWGKGGVFDSLASRSPHLIDLYKKASKMDDLEIGDIHLFPIDDIESRSTGHDFAALVVAQHYKNRNELKYNILEDALKRLGDYATKHKCTVHLPRIGYGLAKFNWYGTERMIRKHLCRRNVPTYIYYFSRRCKQNQQQRRSATPPATVLINDDDRPSSSGIKRSIDRTDSENNENDVSIKKSRSGNADEDRVLYPLPTVFDGLKFCFYDLPESSATKLGRFVVAYDGQWTLDANSDGITHMVVENDLENQTLLESLKAKKIPVVKRNWLEQCVKCKQILPL